MERVTEDKLFNFRPVFFSGAFLALGIGFYYLYQAYGVSVWWTFFLILTVAPLCFCRSVVRAKKILLGALLLIVSFFVGFFSFEIKWRSYTDTVLCYEPCTVQGRVVEIAENEGKCLVVLDGISIEGETQKGRLIAYLPTGYEGDFTLSHTLSLSGDLYTLAIGGIEESLSFIGEDIRYRMYADSYGVGERSFDMFLWARVRVRNVLYQGMSAESASVTMAILTSDTTGIEDGLLENIRYGGIAHIFAVSGLHVGALYGFCLSVFSKTRLRYAPELVRFFTVATLLVLYGGVCGYSPSIIRATVMCLSFYACRLWLYGSDSLERVGLAGIAVLLISPTAFFEAGFALSFSACLGIVLFVRPITNLCNAIANKIVKPREDEADHPKGIGRRIFDFCVSLFAVTASAQIATAPLLLRLFGYLSGWSLLFNVTFVPIITAGFSFLLCLVFLACLLPIACAPVLLFVPSTVWSAVLLLFHAVDLSTFALTGVAVSYPAMYLYGFSCTFLTDKWNVSKRMRILLFCIFFLCFVFSCFFL